MHDKAVTFRDLEVHREFRWITSDGRTTQRWVPVGMPRLRETFEKCAFYLFGHNPKTGDVIGPHATGFFVAKASVPLQHVWHIYAISNAHAVQDSPCIRVNLRFGGTRLIEFDPSEWIISK